MLITICTISDNRNSRKTETGAGTEHGNGNLQNHCYSLDFSPVRFTVLYKPSHWYVIVVKFFLKFFLLHKALSIKRLCKTVYQLMSFVIYYNYTILLSSLLILTLTVRVCYNCFNIWLNDINSNIEIIGIHD